MRAGSIRPRAAVLLAAFWLPSWGALAQTLTPTPSVVVIANIGDFGDDNTPELDVSNLVKGWNPDLITTNGDNNYDFGQTSTIDANIGKYYNEFILLSSPSGYGPGSPFNRFFPVLGNHDWDSGTSPLGCQPYLDWFTLPSGPGNERYYEFAWGPVRFFMVDSDPREPDGISSSSVQAAWLQARLAAATECWKIVQMHHAPYSSCNSHGSTPSLQWPYEAWGASVVIAGHDHVYERLQVGGIPFFVNGTGGRPLNGFNPPLPESQFRYSADYGAMRITASAPSLIFEYYNRVGTLIDGPLTLACNFTATPTATLTDSPTSTHTLTVTPTLTETGTATPTDTGTLPPTPTMTLTQTQTSTPTETPTATPTMSPTLTPTASMTPTLTFTGSPTPGNILIQRNPVTTAGPVTLQLPSQPISNLRVKIFTTSDRKVLDRSWAPPIPGGRVPLDLEDPQGKPLANGLYQLLILDGERRWLGGKLLIIR